ncbi:MAG TPA: 6-carboxytetrahydropterin synthase [Bacteroidia bacterium]|jgi:6-pyruvoyltetrahydropterin/6-carboxytetrahydropterin synthase|nr:6-carboxytetrahydropterin synthase [Bacteroidia bacterium]
MMYVTRRETFNAAHKVYNPEWSEAKNQEVFGGCANPNWHGHNYILFVTVKGEVSKETGFVIDLKKLSQLIKKEIVEKVDHKNFNLDVPFLKDILPSTENVTIAFWNILEKAVADMGCQLHSIKLQETENNYVEYFGEK